MEYIVVSFMIECLEHIPTRGKDLLLISLFVVWNRMPSKPIISEEKCKQIIEDNGYSSTIGRGTTRKSNIENRFRSVYGQLL